MESVESAAAAAGGEARRDVVVLGPTGGLPLGSALLIPPSLMEEADSMSLVTREASSSEEGGSIGVVLKSVDDIE